MLAHRVAPSAPPAPSIDHHVSNYHLSAWIRVWAWCLANHNPHADITTATITTGSRP